MRCRHHARSPRQRGAAEDFVFRHVDRARMEPHAHMDRRIAPSLGTKNALRIDRCEDSSGRVRERDAERVADDTERIASMSRDRFAQQRIVTLRRSMHRDRPAIPEGRTTLDVGKKKREGLRRCSVHFRQSVGKGCRYSPANENAAEGSRKFFASLAAARAMIKFQSEWRDGRVVEGA